MNEEQLQKLTDAVTQLLAVTEGICKTHCPDCGYSHAINHNVPDCHLLEAQKDVVYAMTGKRP